MRIRLFSDMHTEFHDRGLGDIPALDTDQETVLVLAGDIAVGTDAVPMIEELAPRFMQIVYVAGNHEFYDHNIQRVTKEIHEQLEDVPNATFLDGGTIQIDNTVFFGATWWTPMGCGNEWQHMIRQTIARSMNDFITIDVDTQQEDGKRFLPEDAANLNALYFKRLHKAHMKAEQAGQDMVVVTHHAPSELSVHPDFAYHDLNPAYHDDMDEAITSMKQIKLWMHGHMHHCNDYNIEQCRVVSNPYGYDGHAVNNDFNDRLIIEV